MRRCPTCRADSPKLIHFGIYLCPTCGTVDADGNKVQPPPGILLTPASAAVHESLIHAAPTPVADDTQPNNLAAPPPVPAHAMPMPPLMGPPLMGPPVMGPPVMGPPVMGPSPVPLELAPPRPTPEPPRPMPLGAAPPRSSSPDPLTVPSVEVSRTSFAAPPPRDPRDLIDEGSGPPQVLVWMLASYFVFEIASYAFSNLSGCCTVAWMLPRMSFLLALLSGRAWARTASIVGSAIGIAAAAFTLIQPLPNAARALAGLGVVFEIVWVYVLMRPDVVKYFAQKRA